MNSMLQELQRQRDLLVEIAQRSAEVDFAALCDWGLAPLADRERRDLLEVIEDRSGRRATLVTSQVPVDHCHWHDSIGDTTFGDAIMDRLVHHAHRITLTGASLRRLSSTPTESSTEA